MNLSRLTLIISLLLALVLIYTSGLKLWVYSNSKTGFDFFPFIKDYHKMVFWGLMFAQLSTAVLLIFRRTRLLGLYSTFFLLASLSTYLYVMLHYTTHVPCACTGIVPKLTWVGHMWLTIGLALVTAINISFLPDNKHTTDIHARG